MKYIEHDYSHEKGAFLMVFTFVMLILFVMLIFFLAWVRYSGMLRWAISIFALGIVATFFARALYADSIPIKSWERHTDLDITIGSNLEPLLKTVDRAAHGSETSQALLEERLKNLFIERLKDSKELSSDELKNLLNDPSRLKRVVEDDVLTEFLIKGKDIRKIGGHHALYGSKTESNPIKYKKKINRIIKHIEEWK